MGCLGKQPQVILGTLALARTPVSQGLLGTWERGTSGKAFATKTTGLKPCPGLDLARIRPVRSGEIMVPGRDAELTEG